MADDAPSFRIGIDSGGSKLEVAAVAPDNTIRLRRRVPTPADYGEAVAAVRGPVANAEAEIGMSASIGIGVPGRMDRVAVAVQAARLHRPGLDQRKASLRHRPGVIGFHLPR
jgi:fructokinase